MSADLTLFASYCRRMSTADHVDDCPTLAPTRPRWRVAGDQAELAGFTPTPPPCLGCVTSTERDLWAQLAEEIEAYLEHPDEHHAGLF